MAYSWQHSVFDTPYNGLVVIYMKNELAIKMIFDDFNNKMILTDNEKDILIRFIKNDSIVKIAIETNQSERTISRIIANLKSKYKDYKQLELAKLLIFNKKE